MKRLLIVAVLAGLMFAGTAARADLFRIRYKVQYSGGAYLGYPSTTTYSVNYNPMILPGAAGYNAQGGAPNGQPVYPRYVGPGYTVNGHPGPYTSYSYDLRQQSQPQSSGGQYGQGGGCNSCGAGQTGDVGGGSTVILRSGGQISRQPYQAPSNQTQSYSSETAQPVPVAPPKSGVEVPKPAETKSKALPAQPPASGPTSARRGGVAVPVLVADEQEVSN